jgi:ADP-ribose pyrophosphatase
MNLKDFETMPKSVRRTSGLIISGQNNDMAAAKPVVGVGAVVIHQNRVLLVKRKHEPAKDFWAIPGGKVKFGETLQQAAEREILEETGVRIKAGKAVYAFDLIDEDKQSGCPFHYVIIDLESCYLGGEVKAGDDAGEAGWFDKTEIKKLNLNNNTKQLLVSHYEFEP